MQDELVIEMLIRFMATEEGWPSEPDVNVMLFAMLTDDTIVHRAIRKMTAGMSSDQRREAIRKAKRRILEL